MKKINWIASHPIAGTEMSGPESRTEKLLTKDGVFYVHLLIVKKVYLSWKISGKKLEVSKSNGF